MRPTVCRAFVALLCMILAASDAGAARGDRAFALKFAPSATGRSDPNAYLLAYLATVIYPERLALLQGNEDAKHERRLFTDGTYFETNFAAAVGRLFDRPTVRFVYGRDRLLHDPEAAVISTPQAVIIVFRGTDRVGSAKTEFGYQWAEWITTDAVFPLMDPDISNIPGRVHTGFWSGLRAPVPGTGREFREELFQVVKQQMASGNRPLWITAHSLGSAYAQLFAAYCHTHRVRVSSSGKATFSADGITPHGLYAFAAPHAGDAAFRDFLDGVLPGTRFQRFDFVSDPITQLPLYTMGYARGGTRVYYDDVSTIEFDAPERLLLLTSPATDFCFHQPTWYLHAAYQQLSASEKLAMPAPLPQPVKADAGCAIPLTVERALNSPNDELIEAGEDLVNTISYNLDALFDNLTDDNALEGEWTIRCFKDGKHLDISGSCWGGDVCKTQLWSLGQSTGNNVFRLEHTIGGYLVKNRKTSSSPFTYLQPEAEKMGPLPGTAAIQMGKAIVPGPHQIWQFYAVPGRDGHYVIRNAATGQVLDADNACTATNGCRVKEYSPRASDPTQVWVLARP